MIPKEAIKIKATEYDISQNIFIKGIIIMSIDSGVLYNNPGVSFIKHFFDNW